MRSAARGCFVESPSPSFGGALQLRRQQPLEYRVAARRVVGAELGELESRHSTKGARHGRGVGHL